MIIDSEEDDPIGEDMIDMTKDSLGAAFDKQVTLEKKEKIPLSYKADLGSHFMTVAWAWK